MAATSEFLKFGHSSGDVQCLALADDYREPGFDEGAYEYGFDDEAVDAAVL